MLEFEQIVDQLEKWNKGKGFILRALGIHFSSGADLDMARALNTREVKYISIVN